MNKTIGFSVAIALVLIGGLAALVLKQPAPQERTTREMAFDCVSHGGTSYHVHPTLAIGVDGKKETLPANIGITTDCMRSSHTHDATGEIHIEYPTVQKFTLGDFYAVWGQPLQRENFRLEATFNGKILEDPENKVIEDQDKIILSYTSL